MLKHYYNLIVNVVNNVCQLRGNIESDALVILSSSSLLSLRASCANDGVAMAPARTRMVSAPRIVAGRRKAIQKSPVKIGLQTKSVINNYGTAVRSKSNNRGAKREPLTAVI